MLKDGTYCLPDLYPHVYVFLCHSKVSLRNSLCAVNSESLHQRKDCYPETHMILSCCSGHSLRPCPKTCIKIQFHQLPRNVYATILVKSKSPLQDNGLSPLGSETSTKAALQRARSTKNNISTWG